MRGTGDQSQERYGGNTRATGYADGHGSGAVTMHPLDIVSPDLGGLAKVGPPAVSARKPENRYSNGGDALVFIAMGLVSAALALGLYAHIGLGLPVALMAGLGLFVSTSFLHVFVRRMQGVDLLDRRVTALEGKVSHIDGSTADYRDSNAVIAARDDQDVGNFGNASTDPAEIMPPAATGMEDRLTHGEAKLPPVYSIPSDTGPVFGIESLGQELAHGTYDHPEAAPLTGRVAGDHAEVQPLGEKVVVNADTRSDVRSIDGLVRQLSEGMVPANETENFDAAISRDPGPVVTEPIDLNLAAAELTPPQTPFGEIREPALAPRREAGETPLTARPQAYEGAFPAPSPEQHAPAGFGANEALPVDPVGQAILDAASRGTVDIYLQPILSIDDRKVRFFEVLGRIKGQGGDVIAAEDHMALARSVDAVARLDRAIMVRAARLLRKLAERRQAQPLFCNVSSDTLSDPNFTRDFVEFMGGFRDIAPYLIFEINQAVLTSADTATASSIRALSSMGFRLSIDQITNVEQAFASARNFDFSFLKLPLEIFMPAQQSQADARSRAVAIHAAARDSGMTLVIDRIERKDQLASVVSAGVNLGQGYLFSEPKPLLPQVAAEVAEGSVAA